MTFLNPLFLFGLFASVIPVIIHLLNLRKLKTIEFSSLKFLKELQTSKIRSLKIKQWLLLIVRVLIIALLVLAFSRPVLKGYLFTPLVSGSAKSSAVIVLDNTLSMGSTDVNGKFINQAKHIAYQIAEIFTEQDEVALVGVSEPVQILTDGFTHNISLLKKRVEEVNFTFSRGEISKSLLVARSLIENSKNLNREVFIITDLQRSQFKISADDTVKKFPADVKVFVFDVGKFLNQNFSVDWVEVKNKILFPGRTLQIEARVSNRGRSEVSNFTVSLFINGKRVAQKSVDIKPGSSQTVDFNVLPEGISGFVEGFVEIEDDDFNYDNRHYFTVFIPNEIRILLVGDASKTKFIRLAFQTVSELYRSKLFNIAEIPFAQISKVNFANYDVVILVEPNAIDVETSRRLRNFVADGGGIMFFAGPELRFDVFNANFNSVFEIPFFVGIERRNLYFANVDIAHPIFEGIFSEKPKKVDSPEIKEFVRISNPSGLNKIIEMSDGSPFLCEKLLGRGKVLIFTVSPTERSSDFPFKPIFVPLIFQSTFYLFGLTPFKSEYSVGDTLVVPPSFISKYGNFGEIKVVRPDGSDLIVKAEDGFEFYGATFPGFYDFRTVSGDREILKVAFNHHSAESEFEKISEEGLSSYLGKFGLKNFKYVRFSGGVDVKGVILRSRYGVELWKFFLGFAILLLLVESLLSRSME